MINQHLPKHNMPWNVQCFWTMITICSVSQRQIISPERLSPKITKDLWNLKEKDNTSHRAKSLKTHENNNNERYKSKKLLGTYVALPSRRKTDEIVNVSEAETTFVEIGLKQSVSCDWLGRGEAKSFMLIDFDAKGRRWPRLSCYVHKTQTSNESYSTTMFVLTCILCCKYKCQTKYITQPIILRLINNTSLDSLWSYYARRLWLLHTTNQLW